jgi:hypothetical protein
MGVWWVEVVGIGPTTGVGRIGHQVPRIFHRFPQQLSIRQTTTSRSQIFDSIWQEAVASLVTIGVQRLWAKFRNDRAPREVRKLARQWHEQGVSRPWLMEFYLGTREAWDPQALAKRLGITPAEAKRVLYMTGREEELPTGMWVRGKSPDAQLLRGGWEAIIDGDPLFPPEP